MMLSTTTKGYDKGESSSLGVSSMAKAILGDDLAPDDKDVNVDRLVAQELNSLSPNQREQIVNDVHGICEKKDGESPEFIARKLEELQTSLDARTYQPKSAYDMAFHTDPEYVLSRDFRLRFLRADHYDPEKAATRFVLHFKNKLKLFGEKPLCEDITQGNLDKVAIEDLYTGWFQDLPVSDMAGRTVSIINTEVSDKEKLNNEQMLQNVFYAMMVASEDEEAQQNGRVFVIWVPSGLTNRDVVWRLGCLIRSLPVRFAAVHVCLSSASEAAQKPLVELGLRAVDSSVRLRTKIHVGTPSELKCALASFGIPAKDYFPTDDDGRLLLRIDSEKWTERRLKEQSEAQKKPSMNPRCERGVFVPNENDVLLGRGRMYQEHIGNVYFRDLIYKRQSIYDNASKQDKTSMADAIVQIVQSRNGRFLKEDKFGQWTKVSDNVARLKVAYGFRTARHRQKIRRRFFEANLFR